MNILQVLPQLDVGGVETGTVDLSRELVKRGHNSIVVSNGGRLVRELEASRVRHIKLPVHKKSFFTIIEMIKKLEGIIKNERIDIVHARSRVPALISFFAARHTKVRFITTAHGYYSTHLLSRVVGWADFVIVASSAIGRHMIEDFGVPRERIRFIPRGVDLDRFKFNPKDIQEREQKIGVIGRITPIKGHSFFLQSIARVVRVYPKVKILIVGDAPEDKPEYIERLKTLTRQLNIEREVEFLGIENDIPKVMSELDLVVLPSVGQEAFGRVLIEAGACGVPVISTRVGGAVDIVEHERTGILVRPGDLHEMVDSILRLLKDKEYSARLAQEARRKIEREYSLTSMVEATLKVYIEASKLERIVVIKIGSIGDVILAIPSLRAIRNSRPSSHISVLVGTQSRHILKRCPYIDDLLLYDIDGKDRGLLRIFKIGAVIRRSHFDVSIDFQNNRKSHLLAWLGGCVKRYGYNNGKFGFLLNEGIKYLKIKASPVQEQFRLLRKVGIQTSFFSNRLEMWPSQEDFSYADTLLRNEWVSEGQKLVGINIGSSPRWKTKKWPLKNFARLSNMLSKEGLRVVITGSSDEVKEAQVVIKMSNTKVINAVSKTTMAQLAALVKRCSVFVTGDSAPLHVASSMKTSYVALFGPTDPQRHVEPDGAGTIIKKNVHCSPCYKSKCRRPLCMERIGVEEVFREVMEKIKN